jgi:hypothetical protein
MDIQLVSGNGEQQVHIVDFYMDMLYHSEYGLKVI